MKEPLQEIFCPLPSPHVSGEAVSTIDISLKSSNSWSQGNFPANSASIIEIAQKVSPQAKRFNICDGNKENCPPIQFKDNTRNSLEVNVLEISELIARCAPPRNKYAESSSNKSSNSIRLETDGLQFQQTKSLGSDSFVHEYCPAPSFSLGIDDFVPETAVEAVVRDGPSILADREFIQILDDNDEWDFGAVNEAKMVQAARTILAAVLESLSLTNLRGGSSNHHTASGHHLGTTMRKKCFTANLMSIGYIHRLSYMGD